MKPIYPFLAIMVVLSMVLAGCGAKPTETPVNTTISTSSLVPTNPQTPMNTSPPTSTVLIKALLIYSTAENYSNIDESGIATALDEIGISYDTIDISNSVISSAILSNYPTVVISELTLPNQFLQAFRSYVQSGGGLIVTGKAAQGLEDVLGIAGISPKTITGSEEIRFELNHPVSYGAYWGGPIMTTPPMPVAEIPAISQFLYPSDTWPAYLVEASTGTVIGHWYESADNWGVGQQEPAVVVNNFGSGRAVYSGALLGVYNDPDWQWPFSWQRIAINAVEWTSVDNYLVEIGYWPNGDRTAFAWSGDTESPDMVDDVPAILRVFNRLNLSNFGTFFIVGKAGGDEGTDGALEHPEVVQNIVNSGGEVGGHGDVHIGFSSDDLATQETRIAEMISLINEAYQRTGQTLRGFRAPHVDFNRDTLQALADNGVLYDSSDIDVWSEAVLPNFNLVWELPPAMPMDWTLFEDTPVSDEDAITIYKDKFDYFYANRAMFVWLNHPWVIADHLNVLEEVLQYAIDKGDVWMAREVDIVDWWVQRSQIPSPSTTRSGDNLSVSVTNNGNVAISNLTVWLRLPERMNPESLQAVLGNQPLQTEIRQHNGMIFLTAIVPSIPANGEVTVDFSPKPGGPYPTLTLAPTATQIPPTPSPIPQPTPIPSLSRGNSAFSSSVENNDLVPQYAVDGDLSTRWGSLEGIDPQWLYVDLGETKDITRVTITWEDSYATKYEIQVSDDAVNWTTIFHTDNGIGGIEEIPVTGRGRYIRMYGIERGTEWGYSIYEFDVYNATYNLPPIAEATPEPIDIRSYQHGIDFIPLPDGKYYLIWSSSGNPPTGPGPDLNWTHDIYYSIIDPANPVISPIVIISNPEAQEPSSSDISTDGYIMITMEDGWNTQNGIAQRFGVYDSSLAPVFPYPQLVNDGGHSGHVAGVGNRFVVFYSDGWVEGGGVDNLGTGDNVLASIYSSVGTFERSVDIAVGQTTRDWWPLVAGSGNHAALIWQRYVDGQNYSDLMFSLLDPTAGNLLVNSIPLDTGVKYYTYSVTYIPAVDRFLVVGTYVAGGGFAYLLDNDGNIIASNKELPAIVRESQSIVQNNNGNARIAQVIAPNGVMVLMITPSEIQLVTEIAGDTDWKYGGTDGIFISPNMVYIVSESADGLVERTFTLP